MAGMVLFALNPTGATSGPVVRARRDSAGELTNSRSNGMLSRLRNLGGGSSTAEGAAPTANGPRTPSVSVNATSGNAVAGPGPSTQSTLTAPPIVHRSYSTSGPSSSLPSYGNSSSATDVPIPTYETVLTETANRIREMRMSALATANYATTEAGQGPTGLARVRRLGEISESAVDVEDSDEDDPLVPRIRRGAPIPNLRPLRRNTFSGTSSEADAAGSVRLGPAREGPLTPPIEVHGDNEDEVGEQAAEVLDDVPPPTLADDDRPAAPTTDPSRHGLVPIGADGEMPATIDLPAPPANALPAYSAHLGPQELRLISTVHMDESHPAASFFAALANSSVSAAPIAPVDPQRDQPQEYSTGGKKMKLFMNKGGHRMNQNHTGPLYIKVGRGGKIEGRVEVGKVDYGMSLEVAIIGLVNTSYYVRGQYTLIDTLPLVRRMIPLYPAPSESAPEVQDLGPENLYGNILTTTVSNTGAAADAAGPSGTSGPSAAAAETSPTESTGSRTLSRPNFLKSKKSNPNSKIMTKDGVLYLTQGQTFEFNLTMPNQHYRDQNVELPPSCQIYQVGMQAGVEYVLRVKMGRKGWRLNETITLPIVYEPRAYITPRRLRALTTDDPMNPGWRTIRLHGGKPSPKPSTTNPAQPEASTGPGVEGILLLPSPPILFIGHGQAPPPIPFHLHFHSDLVLPLSTFADPRESNFIIRLMRVATLRIGSEKEIRRMEIPSKIEIWQEGGARVRLGDEGSVGGGGVSVRVVDPGPAPPPAFTDREAVRVSEDQGSVIARSIGSVAGVDAETEGGAVSVASGEVAGGGTAAPAGNEVELSVQAYEAATRSATRAAPEALVPVSLGPSAATRPSAPAISTVMSTPPPSRPLTLSPTGPSPTSPLSPTDNGGRRRLSFLRRRSSSSAAQPAPPVDSNISRILSNIPPSISESADPGPAPAAARPTTPEPVRTSLFAPLTLGSTDVHLMGELTIPHKITGTDVVRRMVQSFNTPDIGITYVLEVGIQPKRGAVKEAFEHLWGGGIIEVVLGNRGPDDEPAGPMSV